MWTDSLVPWQRAGQASTPDNALLLEHYPPEYNGRYAQVVSTVTRYDLTERFRKGWGHDKTHRQTEGNPHWLKLGQTDKEILDYYP